MLRLSDLAPKFLSFLMVFTGACTTIRALQSPYRSYHARVDEKLAEDRIFDRGRELVIVKVLPMTPQLREEQRQLSPVSALPAKEGVRQVVLALNVAGKEPTFLSNWEFRLGGRSSLSYDEIRDPDIISQAYYFAHPFYRVFVVDFPAPTAPAPIEALEILSPFGRLALNADFREGGN